MTIASFTLSQQKQQLTVAFADNTSFSLTAEFCRVCAPMELNRRQQHKGIVSNKKAVRFTCIESVGKYGFRFSFDDGFSDVFSVAHCYQLATQQSELWQAYLDELNQQNLTREAMIDIKQVT